MITASGSGAEDKSSSPKRFFIKNSFVLNSSLNILAANQHGR